MFFIVGFALFLINFSNKFLAIFSEEKQHFFYDRTGILNIDGTVVGQSEPIILETGFQRVTCSDQKPFVFRFCPDRKTVREAISTRNKSSPCQEGITFCYEPILTERYVLDEFVLPTFDQLEVSKKCGKFFRGFKVALRFMLTERYEKKLFYEIQLSYKKEPYYFEMPDNMCIDLLLGNAVDLATSVRDLHNEDLQPVKVRMSKSNWTLRGVSANEYANSWLDYNNMKELGFDPSLKMLFLDMKSLELQPQMMFTVGSKYRCNLYTRIQRNRIGGGKCFSRFRQKFMSLRAYGKNATTNYKLTIESGILTNETKGVKKIIETILDAEYGNTTGDEVVDNYFGKGIQTESENIEKEEDTFEFKVLRNETEKKDLTPGWRSTAQDIINIGSKPYCAVATVVSYVAGTYGSCSANADFSISDVTLFYEAYMKSTLRRKITKNSFATFYSHQNLLQTAFTRSRGKTETTTHKEERSMSNAITKRNVLQVDVEVPGTKILTPMQMSVDCQDINVKIPWLKFRLMDDDSKLVEDYYDRKNDDTFDDQKRPSDYDDDKMLDEMLGDIEGKEQQKTVQEVFSEPSQSTSGDDDGDEYLDKMIGANANY